jgi:hypothetical protein
MQIVRNPDGNTSKWPYARSLALFALELGMSALIMVDACITLATGSAVLFVGEDPLFKIWVAFILILLSSLQLSIAQSKKA